MNQVRFQFKVCNLPRTLQVCWKRACSAHLMKCASGTIGWTWDSLVSHNALHLGQWEQQKLVCIFIGVSPRPAWCGEGARASVHGHEASSQPECNYLEMCSIRSHLRGNLPSRCIAAVAMVTAKKKGSLSEDRFSEAKSGVIRSAVRARASVPVRAHVFPVTAGGAERGGSGGCCWVEQVGGEREKYCKRRKIRHVSSRLRVL